MVAGIKWRLLTYPPVQLGGKNMSVQVSAGAFGPSTMQKLAIPQHQGFLEALGRLAIAHTHLELILRYCVKTIADQSIRDALDATEGDRISDLRNKIRQLFKDKKPTSLEKNTLDALLGRAKRLSEKRHSYLHRAWSETDAGHAVVKGEDHLWEPAPSVSEVERVASEILTLGERLNHDRLHGFIRDVVLRQPPRQPHKL